MSQSQYPTFENESVAVTWDSDTLMILTGTDVSRFSLNLRFVRTVGDGWIVFTPVFTATSSTTNSSGTRLWAVNHLSKSFLGSAGIALKLGTDGSRVQEQ